jgi:YesN/AraC family two-component response regulator
MLHWDDIERMLLNGNGRSIKYMKILCISVVNNLVLHAMKEDTSTVELGQLAQFLQSIQSSQTQHGLMERVRAILTQLLEILDLKYNNVKQHSYVQHVKQKVAEHYQYNISFTQIANELHLSRNYLSSLFKRETGVSFSNYLTLYRIEKAKEMMNLHRYMIYEVSEMVGYSDPAYFSRVFKNVTGISPTDYTFGGE